MSLVRSSTVMTSDTTKEPWWPLTAIRYSGPAGNRTGFGPVPARR